MSSTVPIMPPEALALARHLMVDGQLRPTRVSDRRILDAMRRLPREAYLPEQLRGQAYIDDNLRLGEGRVLLKPLVLARLLQLARPRADEAALVVGSGCGYGAAVLAACGVHVTALEESPALLALARAAPADPERTGSLTLVEGALAEGYTQAAPYDLVVIEGAVPEIPPAIGKLVSANGRLVCIVCAHGSPGVAVLAEPSVGGLRARAAFDASAPLLPAFAGDEAGFVF